MLMFAMMLAVTSTIMEIVLLLKFKPLLNFLLKHKTLDLIFSFALSYVLGVMFGASGLIAMTAGIFSTLLSLMVYESGILKQENREKVTNTKNTVVKTIKFWYRVASSPVRAIGWCSSKVNTMKEKVTR